jgi:hypothetical protein
MDGHELCFVVIIIPIEAEPEERFVSMRIAPVWVGMSSLRKRDAQYDIEEMKVRLGIIRNNSLTGLYYTFDGIPDSYARIVRSSALSRYLNTSH